ncbi:hypothetical protein V5T82_15125 [Magnetovibrio sp. PR-2]|uniref:hypothetical protein n=1 Tax=Magnetovibrio sp. PR-2 TaxID=3120356 RepID=UPI002FCE323A
MTEKTNRIVEKLLPLMEAGDWDAVNMEFRDIGTSGLTAEEDAMRLRLQGISAFRQGKGAEALHWFHAGASHYSQNGELAFSFGQQLIFSGLARSGFQIWRRECARFPKLPASYAMAQSRYAYLAGYPKLAMKYLLPVWWHVLKLGISDPTYLIMRELPMFETLWSAIGAMCEELEQPGRFRVMTEDAIKKLKDLDGDRYMDFLDVMETGNADRYEEVLRTYHHEGHTHGGMELRLAILRGLNTDASKARDTLSEVSLRPAPSGQQMNPEYDFPWLEDVRNLALAEAAHRMGDADLEQTHRDAFLQKQGLLMEPWHAFDFRLLKYQDTLKKALRATWKRPDGMTDKTWVGYVAIDDWPYSVE